MPSLKKIWPPLLLLGAFLTLALTGEGYLGMSRQAMDQSWIILGYLVQVGLWLSGAFLVNRVIQVFLWEGLVARALDGPVPRLLKDLTTLVVFLVAITAMIAVVFERSVTGIWATSGVVGLVLGLALRPMILDVFTGLAINIDRSFAIGDWIQIRGRSGQNLRIGEIVEFNWRTTRIITEDRTMVVVPNSQLGTMIVTNYHRPKSPTRFEATFCLDFSVPVERARRIILAGAKAAVTSEGMLEDPEPRVLVHSSTALGVEYKVLYWIEPWRGVPPAVAQDRIATRVVEHLQQAGITLAYPKRDVFHTEMPTRHLDSETTAHREQLLRRVEILAALPPEEIAAVSRDLTRRVYGAGREVITQGDEGDSMFILMEGLLTVHVRSSDSGEETRVAVLEPGDFLGEMSLLTGEPRSATVRAATDAVVYELTHESMSEVFARRPDLAEAIGGAAALRRVRLSEAAESRNTVEIEAESRSLAKKILSKMRSFFGVFKGTEAS